MLRRLDIVSLFPGVSRAILSESILGRAQRRQLVEIRHVNLRDYAEDRRGTVDDCPYGDGVGMLLKPEMIFACLSRLRGEGSHAALMCPQGRPFRQSDARRLAEKEHVILFCGHYEGLDERARQVQFDEEISLGDFVLTNGVAAACVVADAVVRLLPGALGKDESSVDESFGQEFLLEYPHYTRPAEYGGMSVPEALLTGDHAGIRRWRQEQSMVRTASRRPDLFERYLEHR